MKNFKWLLVLAFSTFAIPLIGQHIFQGGGAFSTLKYDGDGESMDFDSRAGFTLGYAYRHPICSNFSVQPELNWLQKGGKRSEDYYSGTISLNYLEIPIYALYTAKANQGFFGGIGPSLNFGLSGKIKYEDDGEGEGSGSSYEEDINFGNGDDDDLKGFAFAINAQAGYLLANGLLFNAFLSQVLSNSATDELSEDDVKIKMFTYGIRIGYMLGRKPAASQKLKPTF